MSTIWVVLTLGTLLLTGCVALLARYHQLRRKRRKGLLRRLSRLGSQHALRFSSQERLKQYLLGLDGIGRRLLVLRHDDMGNMLHWQVIDLQDVNRCSVQTQYGSYESRLQRIALRFERVGLPLCDIVFYQHAVNDPHEAPELEQRARHWEVMLTKMLKRTGRKTA
jgi:hypothetical protein